MRIWGRLLPKRQVLIHENDLQFCMTTTRLLAQRSRAQRARVGSVIFHTARRTIVGVGYNGTAPGTNNQMEENNKTLPSVIHAEDNALRKLSWWDRWSPHLILCVTHAPCVSCAKKIAQSNISTVFFMEPYGSTEGLAHLIKHGITVKRIHL